MRKLLIANRGEIACRIIRTARKVGIATVAVYSDADAGALHVEMADEAVRIGPAPVAESYLRGDAIIAAARATGAEAIHPGYGFLSENPDFVEAVAAAGLVFVGPSAEAIRAMGLKDEAKRRVAEAGVPVVPGYHGPQQDAEFLMNRAAEIGYPVLIKAVAGGGGKGMRLVARAEEFREALGSAQGEAETAFGNGAVLIEKFIESPRHIEIQVFGDGARAVHLFERDCSLQRRHQKVIEEAPAPGMTDEVRAAMGAAAVRAAEAIGYSGAGTVEFIVDGSGPLRADGFWFMEMNTRLQVEHPVTEAITLVDLVEWQIRVARGEGLPMRQEDLEIFGHAFEARLYAEDAEAGFLPAIGKLEALRFPDGVRVDAGVRAGDEISPWYDPMIAKVIVRGPDRAAALAALRAALAGTEVAGTVTNLGFLSRLAGHPAFAEGGVDTGLIGREFESLTARAEMPGALRALACLAHLGLPAEGANGFALWAPLRWRVALEGLEAWVSVPKPGRYRCEFEDGAVEVTGVAPGPEGWRFVGPEGRGRAFVHVSPRAVTVTAGGEVHRFARPDPLARGGGVEAGGDAVIAPMPGLVKRIAAAGDAVAAGDVLAVLEAMKMEHALRAPRGGVVAEARVAAGAQVSDGDVLVTLEPEDD
ncbi:biotin carboxylase N-terminal domain-containing protein [Algicella marina]|uniref:ATP-grasp domain-containing protein n=1 Tax=Algicella marina TaxID=2683284 RepID=A0A6P1T3G6_9RHOB|nr:biotin carboxylase N-terminal domain-containing protein [Algicella marina]QHQ35839.1 ATP-grasp domain-containing protein [Algicella marina]